MEKIDLDELELDFLRAEVFGKFSLLKMVARNDYLENAIEIIDQIMECAPARRLEAVSSLHSKVFMQIQTSVPHVQPTVYHGDLLWAYTCLIGYYIYGKEPIWAKHIQPRLEEKIKNRVLKEEVIQGKKVIDIENEKYVALERDLGIRVPEEQKPKGFYFSYDKVRQQLRISRRVARKEDPKEYTTLDALCYMLNSERVGYDAYGEVEWRAFGISKDKVERMAWIIEKPDEVVRVFTYLSDHAKEVLPADASQDEIESFEYECDRIVNKTIQENQSPLTGGYDENKPYLHMIAMKLARPYAEWSKRDKIIFEHMDKPHDYAYTNLFPFEALYFAAASSLELMASLIESGKIKEPEISPILPNLRAAISMFSYRPVRQHREPIEQALYILSVLAREKAQVECDMYDEIAIAATIYVREKYSKDIEGNVTEAMYALGEYKRKHNDVQPQEEHVPIVIVRQEPEADENPKQKPNKPTKPKEPKKEGTSVETDSSFFAITEKITYEICKTELINIIKNNRYKADICRQITCAANSIYFKFGDKTDDEKAEAINPWIKVAGKNLVFTGEDFRKSRRPKKRKRS